MALSVSPKRAYRSPTVLLTVRSLGSFLRIFSYSVMAFCSLPCWTNFSAALRTFCLLNPKPNAIGSRTPASFPRQPLSWERVPTGHRNKIHPAQRRNQFRGKLTTVRAIVIRLPEVGWLLRVTERECTFALPREPRSGY